MVHDIQGLLDISKNSYTNLGWAGYRTVVRHPDETIEPFWLP